MIEFKEYCVIVLSTVEGVKDEITRISNSKINFINAKGIVMATFKSSFTVKEIETYLTDNQRNFLLYEVDESKCGYNFIDDKLKNALFTDSSEAKRKSEVKSTQLLNKMILDSMKTTIDAKGLIKGSKTHSEISDKLRKSINGGNSGNSKVVVDIETMGKEQLNELMDEILNKGPEDMTIKDKEMLEKIAKKLS
jgi:hypothetical protein